MMTEGTTGLQQRIESGKRIILAEVSPPKGADPVAMRALAGRFAGKVHALGITDNRDGVCMSALAAASLAASEGVEPILHVATRDRNRIALVSDCLGAQALGIRNLLCTTGTHQTLGPARAARNVFDIDSIILLRTYASLAADASIVGEGSLNGTAPLCLGAVASPHVDPLELEVMREAKKIAAGAQFLITQPIFDLERFDLWWRQVTRRGLHEKVAIVAGVWPLASAEEASAEAARRPSAMIPDAVVERIASKSGAEGQREAGIEIAVQTIERLSAASGLRGFEVRGHPDASLAVIERAALGAD
jgi:methylenetetrahydrofolate reductase (NADPH)